MVTILFAAIASVFLQAPAQPVAVPVAPASVSPQTYLVGPADQLGVKVFQEETLSGTYSVDSDGTITFPFLNRIPVAGKTVREIEAMIAKGLEAGYVRFPQVSVEIAQFRSRAIFILGEVRQPGKYSIEGPMTLIEVLARAGSLTPAAGDEIIVQRYTDVQAAAKADAPTLPGDGRGNEIMRFSAEDLQEGRMNANILLQDGDTIVVPAADRFYVTGFVRTPGSFVLTPGMTVRQAIAVAGGLTERGSNRGIKIIRKVKGKEVEVDVDMSDLVQANDTIRVRQRRI